MLYLSYSLLSIYYFFVWILDFIEGLRSNLLSWKGLNDLFVDSHSVNNLVNENEFYFFATISRRNTRVSHNHIILNNYPVSWTNLRYACSLLSIDQMVSAILLMSSIFNPILNWLIIFSLYWRPLLEVLRVFNINYSLHI